MIGLDRRADLESDLTLGATQELALDQAAVPQLQGVGPRDRRRQAKCNDQSAIQLELHDDFPAAYDPASENLLFSIY